MWVGSTPVTMLTPKESREIHRRIRKRREELRQRYPEVHGKVVDFISHSIEDRTLFFSVAFKDTNILVRIARRSDPHHQLVDAALARLEGQCAILHYTHQNIAELWNVMTRPVARIH
jgi:hypothetical protein